MKESEAHIAALRVSEATVVNLTEADWGIGIARLHDAAGILLYLGEKAAGPQEPNSTRSWFEFYARAAYAQVGYTVESILSLCHKAYYIESLIMIRHLLEVVVQLRFFNGSPETLRPHLEDDKRISLHKMFERFSPGFYKDNYGLALSGIAHGKHGAMLFRLDRTSAKIRHGCFYDRRSASLVIYYLLSLVAALFEFYRAFVERSGVAEEVWTDIENYREWFSKTVGDQIHLNPETESWYSQFFQLLGLEPLCGAV